LRHLTCVYVIPPSVFMCPALSLEVAIRRVHSGPRNKPARRPPSCSYPGCRRQYSKQKRMPKATCSGSAHHRNLEMIECDLPTAVRAEMSGGLYHTNLARTASAGAVPTAVPQQENAWGCH
jgi:hypothetical protein